MKIASGVIGTQLPTEKNCVTVQSMIQVGIQCLTFAVMQKGKMMDDLIKRQDAINAVNTALFPKINTAKEAEKVLKALPSAQKTGHWINRSLNILYPEWERYICSSCGKCSNNYDYCPHCGARMELEEE